LSKPSSESEAWRGAADQMEPSEGAGSGNIEKESKHNDAQWLRAFSLVVYKSGVTDIGGGQDTSATGDYGGGGDTGGNIRRLDLSRAFLPRARRGRRGQRGQVIPFRRPGLRDDPAVSSTDSGGNAPAPAGEKEHSEPGLDLSNLRCYFSVQKSTSSSPNIFYARVYNLAPETLAKVIEFTRVRVLAGYRYANYGLIFDGTVVQYRRGKENPVDSYIEIHAADGRTINEATAAAGFPAGTKKADIYQKLLEERKKLDDNEHIKSVDYKQWQETSQRHRIILGHVRDYERQLHQEDDMHGWTENGEYVTMLKTAYLDDEAVVLSPKTGLVSQPEVTPQGIQIKCLLNPRLKLGGLVQIDTNILSGVAYTPGTATKTVNGQVVPGDPTGGMVEQENLQMANWGGQLETAYTSPKGRYKILLMTISGDTRGNQWYCDLICVALDSQNRAILGTNQSNAFRRASPEAREGVEIAPTRRVVNVRRR
jgi:hypothetical protein